VAHATVWRALDALPPRRRAVVVLHELEELDAKDIAKLLGITTVTVRWHLSRGRRELTRILKATDGEKK
jgi:RNA polymerase sigma factor (sigma-70 family)